MNFNMPESAVEKPRIVFITKAVCPCGHEFYPYRPYQRFCCDKHRVKYQKLEREAKASTYKKQKEVTKQCKECGKDYVSNDSKRHYCSKECYLLYQTKRLKPPTERVCPVCKKTFLSSHYSKVYCSKDCRGLARQARI